MAKRTNYVHIHAPEELGDYERLFLSGYSSGRTGDQLKLRRTGPAVPPITVVGIGDLVVTESARASLESVAGVRGFRPVLIEQATRFKRPKSGFNPSSREMIRFGEPESIIDDGPHDPTLLKEMGTLYEVLLEIDGVIDEDYDDDGNPTAKFKRRPKGGWQLFYAMTPGGYTDPVAEEQFYHSLPGQLLEAIRSTPVQ
jgi:hypothetical protein